MSFINKIKNFFYDEEEIDEEEYEQPKKEIKKEKEPKKEKRINIYDIEKEQIKEKEKFNHKPKNDISERELFKSEKTFNFPMDMDEDEDFEPAITREIRKEQETKMENTNRISRINRTSFLQDKKVEPSTRGPLGTSSRNYSSVSHDPYAHKKEEKKFKPTPIISPIYGILNKNYEKDDITSISETKEFKFDKVIDFDTVRRKAYGEEEEKKTIFYNLDEDKKDEIESKEEMNEEYQEEPYKKDEVIITYEQVPEDKEPEPIEIKEEVKEEEEQEEVEIPKITRKRATRKKVIVPEEEEEETEEEDRKILEDTEEHDLFNLIDNMYSNEEEEENE